MNEYWQGFVLGNGAILGNVCMLPLYPGMFVLFANQRSTERARKAAPLLGVVVLAGVLTVMVAFGAVLYRLRTSFSEVLDYVLPISYGLVLVLGVAMLRGANPFARMTTVAVPVVRNPLGMAFVYGAMLGPLTLPCTGPLILSAFTIGGVAGTTRFLDSLAYFVAFGLGFGWPLVALPLLAHPLQRRIVGALTRHHRRVEVVSGVLLISLAIVGLYTDVLPNVG